MSDGFLGDIWRRLMANLDKLEKLPVNVACMCMFIMHVYYTCNIAVHIGMLDVPSS